MRRMFVVIAAAVVSIGILGSCSKPQAASDSNAIDEPAASQTWTVVKFWQGVGIKNTEQFTVGSEWRISWAITGGSYGSQLLQVYVYRSGTNALMGVVANTTATGGDSSYEHVAGTYYLKINAIGSWKVQVDQLE